MPTYNSNETRPPQVSENMNNRSHQSASQQQQRSNNQQVNQRNSERRNQNGNDQMDQSGRNAQGRPTSFANPASIKRPVENDRNDVEQSREKPNETHKSSNSKREHRQEQYPHQPPSNNQVTIDNNRRTSADVVVRNQPGEIELRKSGRRKKEIKIEEVVDDSKRYSLPPKLVIDNDFEEDDEEVIQSSTPPAKDAFGKRRFNLKNIFGSGKRKSQKPAPTPDEADIQITEVPSPGVKFTDDDTGRPLNDTPDTEHKSRKKSGKGSGRFNFMNKFRTRSISETRSASGGSIISSGLASNPQSSQPSFSVKPESSSTPTTPVVMRRQQNIRENYGSRYHNQAIQSTRHMNRSTSLQHLRQPTNLIPGVCGLANPDGLTCYVNSIIQCLCHIDPLSQYLATNDYSADIDRVVAKWNKDQPRDLTDAVANLLRSLWRHTYRPKITELFRIVVNKYKPEFATKRQQDAHEFMVLLLDALHEESNQSRKKLYRSKSKTPTQMISPSDVAQAAIDLSKHNQSIMYKLFAGLQQCCVICPRCKVTYRSLEPYMCLSLPIPTIQKRPIFLTHVDLKVKFSI